MRSSPPECDPLTNEGCAVTEPACPGPECEAPICDGDDCDDPAQRPDDPAGPPVIEVCIPGDASLGFGIDAECKQPPAEFMRIDWGLVPVGAANSLTLVLRNDGGSELHFDDIGVDDGLGGLSEVFSVGPKPRGMALASGERFELEVAYKRSEPGADTGRLVILSDDPAEPRIEVVLEGRGELAPIAIAGDDIDAEPLDTVTLDGSASYDPDGEAIVYLWRFWPGAPNGGRPDGSRATLLQGGEGCLEAGPGCRPWLVDLYADIAGTYYVELVVTDVDGLSNVEPEVVTITAVPSQALHVQLVWDHEFADLDLHLVREGGTPFTHDDCYYANCTPAAYAEGESVGWCDMYRRNDDPSLDIDDRRGYGPENVNIRAPCRDGYSLFVHYWTSYESAAPEAPATVRVYCNGERQFEMRRTLERDLQFWEVGTLYWPSCEVDVTDRMLFHLGSAP